MERTRRNILKLFGISALGVSVKPVFNAFASEAGHLTGYRMEKGKNALKARQWAMVIDTRQFHSPDDLKPLIDACHQAHNVPDFENKNHEIKWIWEEEYHHAFPNKATQFLNEAVEHRPFMVLCNHCENPPCCRACPTKATFKRKSDGIVMMDFHRCIGCRFCMAACPFGSRSFNFRDPRPGIPRLNKNFPTRTRGVVEKCNFCAERLAVGKMPYCVEASNGALAFGDLYDPDSTVRQLLKENYTIRRKQGLGTEPSVYYIV
ncbi:MAG: 4Fe-4S ferredoxin [Deltaproteobacteria bacterium]|nr:MAG: 4Fe-4S ferredoxin [Deltaproteobacteria bacterium]